MKNASTETGKHTPGPWYLYVTRGTIQVSDGPEPTNESAVVHWAGFDSGDKPLPTRLANARLIAAAPDLLAVCECLVGAAGVGMRLSERVEMALAAIRKARGG